MSSPSVTRDRKRAPTSPPFPFPVSTSPKTPIHPAFRQARWACSWSSEPYIPCWIFVPAAPPTASLVRVHPTRCMLHLGGHLTPSLLLRAAGARHGPRRPPCGLHHHQSPPPPCCPTTPAPFSRHLHVRECIAPWRCSRCASHRMYATSELPPLASPCEPQPRWLRSAGTPRATATAGQTG
jgi:hypothetical protein